MKFSCTRDNLSSALGLTSAAAGKNLNLPILNNILLRADTQKVELVSTNLEIALIATIRAKTDDPGTFTVPARTLAEFVGLLTHDKVDLELVENELVVKCGSSSTKIKGVSAEDFPIIPTLETGQGIVISAEVLKEGLSQVLPAVAKNDIRPELSGVFCGININEEGKVVLAATDSYRLAEKTIPLLQGTGERRLILPGRTAQELQRILGVASNSAEQEKNVRIMLGENQASFSYNNVQLITRLVDGTYPDYRQIIPQEFKTSLTLMVNNLIKEIKAAGLFTTSGVNAVTLTAEPETNFLELASASSQTGEHRSSVEAEIKGEKNSIFLSHRYLLDGLNIIKTEQCQLQLINGESPCLLTPVGDKSLQYIIMPVRQ